MFFWGGGRCRCLYTSNKQTTLALSSIELESVAATLETKEGIWIKAILEELKLFSYVNTYICTH